MLEMVVTLLLVSLILVLAMRMVLDAQARIAHSGRRALDMSIDQAFTQMRIDIRGCRVFGAGYVGGEWQTAPLTLEGHFSGDTIVYERHDDELRRVVYTPPSLDPVAWRPVAQNVRRFRWRENPLLPGNVLEIDLSYDDVGPLAKRSAAGQQAAELRRQDRQILIRPRDVDGARWW